MKFDRRTFGSASGNRFLLLAVAAVIAGYVSVLQQRFVFGVVNNVFHIPLVLRWADDPVFADDQFVQSLKNFASPVWLGVRLFATEDNIESVFYLFHVLTRATAILALVWASAGLGVRGLIPGVALAFWFGISPVLRWEVPIGFGEIFVFYFSHSAIAIPLTIFAIGLAVRRSYLFAFATLGFISNVNAFAAAWAGCAVVGVAFGDKNIREAAVKSIGGLMLAALLSLPVAVWLFDVLQSQPVSDLEHERFLREYAAGHFFIDGAPMERLVLLGGVALSGLVGFRLLSDTGEAWSRALIAVCVLVVAGMILPEMVTSRFFLDLHLLRAASLIQLLGILGLTASAISSARRSCAAERLGGFMALCLLALPALQGTMVAAAVLLAARYDDWRLRFGLPGVLIVCAMLVVAIFDTPVLCIAEIGAAAVFIGFKKRLARLGILDFRASMITIAILVIGVACYTYRLHESILRSPSSEDAIDVAKWARKSTPDDAMFLVPQAVADSPYIIIFESLARRRTWVDWKRGGAVMWAPSYYEEWSRRMAEVNRLPDLESRMAYACGHHINYVLVGARTEPSNSRMRASQVYGNAHFQVFDARRWCGQE
jgi:hypothetical protein